MQKNIEQLQNSKRVAYNKMVYLESNMRVKQGGKADFVMVPKPEGEERMNALTML